MDFYNQLLAQKLSGGGGGDSSAAFKALVDGSITDITADMLTGAAGIRNYAFYACTSLASVTISSGVTSIGQYVFSSCSSLTSIEIPNTVTSIGIGAFNNCTKLANVTLPNNISIINNNLFTNCRLLINLTLPDSVTSIGSNAFQNYSGNWESLTVLSAVPPTANAQMFNCPVDKLTIYVPANSVDAYKSASTWSIYADKIQAIPSN